MNAPQIWIAFLRIVVGAWFLKAVWTKLVLEFAWGIVPYIGVSERFLAFHPKRVAEFAAGNPIGWYKEFLHSVVLPNARLFATLQSYGEVIVGIGLVVGFCVGATALLGLLLTVNYGLATQWMSFGQQGFHLLLISSMVIFLGARAGRVWGIDGLMLRYAPVIREKRWRAATLALIALMLVVFTGIAGAADLRIFVSNEKSDNITVFSGDGRMLATIPVGKRPRGIAAARDGSRVFNANSDSNEITAIDPKTLTVVDRLPAGVDPEGMTLDRNGRIYVVNENDSALTIIDPGQRRIQKRLEVGTEPETAVLSPDGRWVVVSNETSNEIHFVDTATTEIVGKVSVPQNPRGMRFTADSKQLYVASERAHMISLLDVEKRTLLNSVATGGERPVDIIISRDGTRLYVSHGASGDVRVFETASLKPVATIPVGPRAWWMALTPDGNTIYVTVGRANQVVAIDTQTNTVKARLPAGTLPWGIAITELP